MAPAIGFVLLTHEKPYQIVRLVARLNYLFDNPPIVCHHDFSKCSLPSSPFPANVSFVQPHLQTSWGKLSVVEATVRAIRQMYESKVSPDWFVLLSGADYPIKPAAQVLRDLSAGSYDAHIDFTLIRADKLESDLQKDCFKLYCTKSFAFPSLTRRLRPTWRTLRLRHPLLTRLFLPFSKNLQCYAGSSWFCANRRSAERIISFHATKPNLANHYRRADCVDESYFQTILANAPDLKLNNNNWRYTDWSAKAAHPKTLTLEDVETLAASTAHFARKLNPDVDAKVLDALDALVG